MPSSALSSLSPRRCASVPSPMSRICAAQQSVSPVAVTVSMRTGAPPPHWRSTRAAAASYSSRVTLVGAGRRCWRETVLKNGSRICTCTVVQ